jgi:antimicrobial peptide system SdpB family protein
MSIKINKIISNFETLIDLDYWNISLGLARTSLAFGLLLTLLLNSNETLFSFGIENEILPEFNKYDFINIYNIIKDFTIAKYISIFVLILIIIGIYPRYTCIFHWWVTFSFFNTSFAIDGGDQINNILTLLLIPICITDNRKSHWKKSNSINISFLKKSIVYFTFIIIEIQVSFLYFQASVGKFKVIEWVNGTAIYYWFTNQSFGMNDLFYPFIMPLLKNPFSLTYITWSVLLLELILFSCMFIHNKKVKRFAWYLGITFHLGIIFIHGLISFFFSMLGALTLYLITKKQKKL